MGVALLLLGRWRPGFSTCKEVDTLLYVKPPKNLINVTVELLFKRQCMLWAVPKLPSTTPNLAKHFSSSHFGQNTGGKYWEIFPIKRPFCHRQEAIGIWNQWIVSQNDYAHLVLIPTIQPRTHIFPTNCNKHNEAQRAQNSVATANPTKTRDTEKNVVSLHAHTKLCLLENYQPFLVLFRPL